MSLLPLFYLFVLVAKTEANSCAECANYSMIWCQNGNKGACFAKVHNGLNCQTIITEIKKCETGTIVNNDEIDEERGMDWMEWIHHTSMLNWFLILAAAGIFLLAILIIIGLVIRSNKAKRRFDLPQPANLPKDIKRPIISGERSNLSTNTDGLNLPTFSARPNLPPRDIPRPPETQQVEASLEEYSSIHGEESSGSFHFYSAIGSNRWETLV